jgi:hypothetical protein
MTIVSLPLTSILMSKVLKSFLRRFYANSAEELHPSEYKRLQLSRSSPVL